MFPRWFDKWNRENPRDIYGPAIAIGVVGGAVFAATMLVAFGQPYATDSLQTGPRGTGMSVPEFEADLAKPDPGIAGFLATTSTITPSPHYTCLLCLHHIHHRPWPYALHHVLMYTQLTLSRLYQWSYLLLG